MKKTCIVLLSGGLDSLLALRLMTAQGLRAVALHTINCFHGTQDTAEKKKHLAAAAAQLGADATVFADITPDVIALTKRPRHGYGRHLNACIDCRLATLAAGKAEMANHGAEFIVTGEVVGQRPMSQRRDAIATADRMAETWGIGGRILRPLSAQRLDATVPEREGWVDADTLLDISGRGRGRQMALARRLGVVNYPAPAGGCLLTDPGFAGRLAVLARFKPDWNEADAELLKVGRAFQVTPAARVAVGRNEDENRRLAVLAGPGDRLYANATEPGATALLRGEATPEAAAAAAGLAAHYSKSRGAGGAGVRRWRMNNGREEPEGDIASAEASPAALREREEALAGADCLKQMRSRGRLD